MERSVIVHLLFPLPPVTASSDFVNARERARAAAADVDGWLSEAQGETLFAAAARAEGRGRIVEIGSWKGRSTVWLAAGARLAGQQVFAIDPHAGSREDPAARTFDTFASNMRRAGVHDIVTPLVMSSADAARQLAGGVEILFIDGDHSEAGANADLEIWLPRLVDGGTLLMHDVVSVSFTGPLRAFRRRICWSGEFRSIRRVGSMGIATRAFARGPGAVVSGWIAGLLLYVVDAKRMLRKVRTS